MTLAIIFDSVGVGEWFVLLAVILVVVGPKRLPSTARKVGAYYSKFRRAADSFKRQLLDMDTEFTNSVRDAANEVKSAVSDMSAEFSAPVDATPTTPATPATPADVPPADVPAADSTPSSRQPSEAPVDNRRDEGVASTYSDVHQD